MKKWIDCLTPVPMCSSWSTVCETSRADWDQNLEKCEEGCVENQEQREKTF